MSTDKTERALLSRCLEARRQHEDQELAEIVLGKENNNQYESEIKNPISPAHGIIIYASEKDIKKLTQYEYEQYLEESLLTESDNHFRCEVCEKIHRYRDHSQYRFKFCLDCQDALKRDEEELKNIGEMPDTFDRDISEHQRIIWGQIRR